jgi:hypothetical protein
LSVDLVEVQAIYYMMAATGVLVAAIYYIFNMRATLQTRQAQLFTQFLNNMDRAYWSSFEDIRKRWQWKNYEDFMSKYGPDANPDEWLTLMYTLYPFEQLGILTKQRLFDPPMMYQMVGGFIIGLWEKVEPIFNEYRKRMNAELLYEYTEDFYYVMKEIQIKDEATYKDRYVERKNRRKTLVLEPTALYPE